MKRMLARLATVLIASALLVGIAPSPQAEAATPPQACWKTLDGVTTLVAADQKTVTIVRGTGGSRARVSFWVRGRGACTMNRLFLNTSARVGYGGIVDGATRQQGTGTTPRGTYTMTEAFGLNAKPRTAMPYRRVAANDYWVQDNNSPYYNTFRNAAAGGFDVSLPESHPNGSERLANYPTQYALAVVINFNRAPDAQVPGRGSGIFLHVAGRGATAGCVGITLSQMRTVMANLRPGDRIVIQ